MQNLNITLLQADQYWEDKARNLAHYELLLEQVDSTDLILLPEMFHTGFTMNASLLAETMDNSIGLTWLRDQAAKRQTAFYTSLIILENGHYYNRGVFVEPNGNITCYDKRKLFGMAEETNFYSGGNKEVIVTYKNWNINLQICYDLRFPENIRNNESEGKARYDLLLYVANWPERRITHWSALLPARAIENQCYVAGVNRVGTDNNGHHYIGESAVINMLGEKVSNLLHTESIIQTEIDYSELTALRSKLPFLKDA